MLKNICAIAIIGFALLAVLGTAHRAMAQDAAAKYAKMAPVDQYLMADRDAEIALARSAAPESISRDAGVMVMGRHGYEVAAQGKNGFVCVVERSWTGPKDFPDFWNPKLRAPICFNAPAARTYLQYVIKKTAWILAGQSQAQMFANIKAALEKKELPAMAPGAMCYMLSKQGYLGDDVGHWHPHLMFFVPQMGAQTWGADLPDSPVFSAVDAEDRLTVFMVPVGKWSDGTDDHQSAGHQH